ARISHEFLFLSHAFTVLTCNIFKITSAHTDTRTEICTRHRPLTKTGAIAYFHSVNSKCSGQY
ncbi:hypothetical protein L9F63_009223, partial [Diploptera punctata]